MTNNNHAPGGNDQAARLMPHSVEMEQLVLGAMMLNAGAIERASVTLGSGEAFYQARHSDIYSAILRLHNKEIGIDVAILAEDLERNGDLEACGGFGYLADLAGKAGTSANVEYHSKLIVEHQLRRKLIALTNTVQAECYESADDVTQIFTKFEMQTGELSASINGVTKHENMVDILRGILSGKREPMRMIKTRFPDPSGSRFPLDAALGGGFALGRLSVVFAPQSGGKTSFAVQLAYCIASGGTPVGYINMEDEDAAVAGILLTQRARIDPRWQSEDGEHSLGERRRKELKDDVDAWEDLPLYMHQLEEPSLEQLFQTMKSMIQQHGVQFFMLDYLTAMEYPERFANQVLPAMLKTMAAFARTHHIHIMVLHHSRTHEDQQSKQKNMRTLSVFARPGVDDMALSQRVKWYAFYVIAIHAPCLNPNAPKKEVDLIYEGIDYNNRSELGILKYKEGVNGTWLPFGLMPKHRLMVNMEDGVNDIPLVKPKKKPDPQQSFHEPSREPPKLAPPPDEDYIHEDETDEEESPF